VIAAARLITKAQNTIMPSNPRTFIIADLE
jgi:hypothetical protein